MPELTDRGRIMPLPVMWCHTEHSTCDSVRRMGMARRVVSVTVLSCVTLGALGCSKAKLEATLKGYKPGSPNVVLVHVKGDKGASVECTEGGLPCPRVDLGALGEIDMEIDLTSAGDKPKVAFLLSRLGRREAKATVNLDAGSGLAARVEVSSGGVVTCISRTCTGLLSLAPTASISLTVPPGTTAQIGTQQFKADAKGEIRTPLTLTTTPPLKDLPASKLCTHDAASPVGRAKLTLTFADGATASADAALTTDMVSSGLGATLSAIKRGPVPFPWEKAGAAARPKRAAFSVDQSGCNAFGGPADATLADVAVLVVTEPKGERTDKCTYAITDPSGASSGSSSGRITLYDETAIAYDRVTGKKLAERVFQAPKICDQSIKLTSATTPISDQQMHPLRATVATWAATVR